ncbi:MAG: TonB-dependent receptor plug domain-containing protein [Saprospiraceae bacterium]
MKSFILSAIAILSLFSIGCSSSKSSASTTAPTQQKASNPNTVENPNMAVDLVDHLRRVPGLSVTGQGSNASVSIRGAASFNTDVEPLFVINGTSISGGLSEASSIVSVADIKTIRVLKSTSETSEYGLRGSNGVIVITLK